LISLNLLGFTLSINTLSPLITIQVKKFIIWNRLPLLKLSLSWQYSDWPSWSSEHQIHKYSVILKLMWAESDSKLFFIIEYSKPSIFNNQTNSILCCKCYRIAVGSLICTPFVFQSILQRDFPKILLWNFLYWFISQIDKFCSNCQLCAFYNLKVIYISAIRLNFSLNIDIT